MATGTVKFYNAAKGFGFNRPVEGEQDIFVHISALHRAGLSDLVEGQKLEFDVTHDQRGRSAAANLKRL